MTEYRPAETVVGANETVDIPPAAIAVEHERLDGPRVRVSWLEPADGGQLL